MNAPLEHAEIARLAHQCLRLREAGIDSEREIRELAAQAPAALILGVPEATPQTIGIGARNPRAETALSVVKHLLDELPGPTAPGVVMDLMRSDLSSIHAVWDEAVTANLEQTLPADALEQWRASVARDAAAAEDRAAAMLETGAWPVHPVFGHDRHADGAANALYDLGREGILDGSIDVVVASVKVVLVDSADYAVNLATHQFLSSVAVGGRVATSGALATKTKAAGVFDADDALLSTVTGDPSEALVLVQSSAVGGGADVADTSQRLIAYWDTATGLPVTPNGGNIAVTWDSGANRIFKL